MVHTQGAQHTLFAAVVEQATDGICCLDLNYTITYANAAFARLLAYDDPAALLGLPLAQLICDPPQLIDVMAELLYAQGRYQGVLTYRCGNESTLRGEHSVFVLRDITDQISGFCCMVRRVPPTPQALTALGGHDALLAQLLDHVPAAIYAKDMNGTILLANQHSAAIMGHTPEQVVGRNHADLMPAEVVARWREQERQALAERRMLSFEETIPYGDEVRTYLTFRFLLTDIQGEPVAVAGISTDITQQKNLETDLSHALALQQATIESSSDGILVSGLDGQVITYNQRWLELWRLPADTNVYAYPSAAAMCLALLTPQVRDPEAFQEHTRQIRQQPEQHTSDTIILRDGRVLSRTSSPYYVGGHLAGRMWILRDITEPYRAEQALRESQARLQAIFDNAAAGIALIVPEGEQLGRFSQVNHRFLRMLGYNRAELQQLGFLAITHPDDLELSRDHWQRLEHDLRDGYRIEKRYLRKDGSVLWVDMAVQALRDEHGALEGALAVLTDITERKLTEESYRAIVEHSLQGLSITRDGRPLYVNPATEQLTGYTLAEMQQMSAEAMFNLIHPADRERMGRLLAARIAGQAAPVQYEFRMLHKSGAVRWMETFVTRINYQGQPAVQMTYIDITERKEAEAALRQSQALLQGFVDNVPALVFMRDLEGRFLLVNRAYEELAGRPASELLGQRIEDVLPAQQAIPYRAQDQETLELGAPTLREYTDSISGKTVIYLANKFLIHDSEGQPYAIGGISTDITDQRQVAAALQEQRSLMQAFLDHSPTIIAFKDAEGRYITANARYAASVGRSEAELLGKTPADLFPPHLAQPMIDQDAFVIETGQSKESEYVIPHPEGEHVYLTVKFPLYDEAGTFAGIGAVGTDISERKQAEEALRASEARYRGLLENLGIPVATYDYAGEVLALNTEAARILGGTRETLVGKRLHALFPTEQADSYLARVRHVIDTGERDEHEDYVAGPDGTEPHWFWTLVAPLYDAAGQLSAAQVIAHDITGRKKAEDEVAIFKALVDNAMDGVILHQLESTVYYANAAAGRLLGTSPAELIGSNATHLLMANEVERLEGEIIPALRARGYWLGESWSRRRDGSPWLGQSSIVVLRDNQGKALYAASIFRDITQQRQMEEELRLTQFALDHAPDGVSFIDEQGSHRYVNHALASLLGYSREHLRTLHVRDIDPELTPERWQAIWAQLRQRGSGMFEAKPRQQDGSRFPVEIASNYLEFQGKAYLCSFMRDITERKAYQQQIEQLAFADPLTGLANRRRLYAAGADALAHASSIALLYLDLDRFKAFNDTLGHDAGDMLLVYVTERLRQGIADAGLLARLGGDEFALLLIDVATEQAIALGHHLLDQLHQPFEVQGHRVHLSGSIGVTCEPVADQAFSMLLTHADIAMYEAKRNGGGLHLYDPLSAGPSPQRLQLENELRAALAGDGLTLHYQPILDLHTRSLLAVEALVRWPHPQLGLLRPGEFLPLAEEAGLLGLLDEWVLHTALKQVAAWQAAGQPLTVSVNLGGPALRRANLVEKVAALLAETGVPSAQLVLEITEHMALHDMETTHAVLSELQQLGVRIALDDFGTGYASLSHLRELPVDILKIERVFAQGIGCSAKDEAVIQSMLALGRGLDIIVVAEGVEEEAQRDWLQAAGCRHIQGYLISRPVPPASINGVHG